MIDDDTRRTRLEAGPLARPLQQALWGAVFPLSTEQLVPLARENEAPAWIVSLLSDLPGRRFDSLEAVQRAVESRGRAGEEGTEPPFSPMLSY